MTRASDVEVGELLPACRSARDRLLVLLLARAGLRRSEAVGLRRADIHFLIEAKHLGCSAPGSHLHVIRRDNMTGAWAKSRRSRVVPVDFLVVQAFDQYTVERAGHPGASESDLVLVNLFRPPGEEYVRGGPLARSSSCRAPSRGASRRATERGRHRCGSWLSARAAGSVRVAELGGVTRTLLAIAGGGDDRALAEQICRACVAGLDIDGAGISLLTASTSRETLFASDATAELLEDLQFTLAEGACMEAAVSGRPVLVPDLRHPTEVRRWPVFAAAVLEQSGVRALFALPLQWGTVNLGVLDLYRRAPGLLGDAQLRDAMSAADMAALMMLGVRTDPGDGLWLDDSLNGRAEIHQAAGMVLAQLGVSATDALARMRAYAFAEQRLLSEVAHDVVSRRLRFTRDMA